MAARGWSELDVLLVSGDAYVDHPAFGAALVGRWLESLGLRVGIVAQPDWRDVQEVSRLGRPRLFVGVTAGNLDSMLARYTAQHRPRREDAYSPGGRVGLRPDRASIAYAQLCRRAFGAVPIVLGGIEASLRRIAHYDTWSEQVRRSVLLDAKADLLVYGMAERALSELVQRLRQGEPLAAIRDVRGTAFVLRKGQWESLSVSERVGQPGFVRLPAYAEVCASKPAFAEMTRLALGETNPFAARPLLQPHGDEAVVILPPAFPLEPAQLDALYELPFERAAHPSYQEPIPALATVVASVVSLRGCFGGCAFCSLTLHQGRDIQSRSVASIEREVRALVRARLVRGTLSDVGGPTANMYGLGCGAPALRARCRRPSCLHPRICRHLSVDHSRLSALLGRLRAVPGIEHVYLASGIRHDLALRAPDWIRELAAHHTPGQLSVAPEHASGAALACMRKPPIGCYERFATLFARASRAAGKEQYLVPYLLTGHPGTTLAGAVELALFLARHGLRPRQIQEHIATPMTLATCMVHTGLDPLTGRAVPVVRGAREQRLHKALALYWDPAHHDDVREALARAGRTDLIGTGPGALVPPARGPGALPRRPRPARPRR